MAGECVINTYQNLDDVLKMLNQIILYSDSYIRHKDTQKEPSDFKKKFDGFMSRFKAKKNKLPDNPVAIYQELSMLCGGDQRYQSTRARTLFNDKRKNIRPFLGTAKEGKAFANKNLVIGVKSELYDGTGIEYRVDYDPKKGFHINLTLRMYKGSKEYIEYDYALIVKAESNRYNVPLNGPDDEKTQQELMKYKFFIKMTLGYLLRHPDVVLQKATLGTDPNNIWSVSGVDCERKRAVTYFLQGEGYNYNTLRIVFKNYLQEKYHDSEYVEFSKSLNKCNNGKELLELLNSNTELRHSIVELAIRTYTKYELRLDSLPMNSEELSKTVTSEEEPPKKHI